MLTYFFGVTGLDLNKSQDGCNVESLCLGTRLPLHLGPVGVGSWEGRREREDAAGGSEARRRVPLRNFPRWLLVGIRNGLVSDRRR